ncbi:MAG: hypothetical protein RMK84_05065 [Oscillochloridaceae bacterium]|nr:hypothetical protein [Chloroflexaceae bacterium]MDW8389473.1 hypothetical protein [Oscillochloridaceae bacterium]
MSSRLTTCPRCGARLKGPSTRCDACGADLVPYLARSGANTASVLAPPSPAIASVDRQAPVAPPDPAPGSPASLSFDYTTLERPAISETLEMAPWRSVLSELAMWFIVLPGAMTAGLILLVVILPDARQAAHGLGSIVGSMLFLMALVVVPGRMYAAKLWERMHQYGRQTSGVIFDRWTDKDYEGDTTYFVAYAFQAEGAGQSPVIVTRAEKNQKLYERYRVGDVIAIRYLISDPSIAVVVS